MPEAPAAQGREGTGPTALGPPPSPGGWPHCLFQRAPPLSARAMSICPYPSPLPPLQGPRGHLPPPSCAPGHSSSGASSPPPHLVPGETTDCTCLSFPVWEMGHSDPFWRAVGSFLGAVAHLSALLLQSPHCDSHSGCHMPAPGLTHPRAALPGTALSPEETLSSPPGPRPSGAPWPEVLTHYSTGHRLPDGRCRPWLGSLWGPGCLIRAAPTFAGPPLTASGKPKPCSSCTGVGPVSDARAHTLPSCLGHGQTPAPGRGHPEPTRPVTTSRSPSLSEDRGSSCSLPCPSPPAPP